MQRGEDALLVPSSPMVLSPQEACTAIPDGGVSPAGLCPALLRTTLSSRGRAHHTLNWAHPLACSSSTLSGNGSSVSQLLSQKSGCLCDESLASTPTTPKVGWLTLQNTSRSLPCVHPLLTALVQAIADSCLDLHLLRGPPVPAPASTRSQTSFLNPQTDQAPSLLQTLVMFGEP